MVLGNQTKCLESVKSEEIKGHVYFVVKTALPKAVSAIWAINCTALPKGQNKNRLFGVFGGLSVGERLDSGFFQPLGTFFQYGRRVQF